MNTNIEFVGGPADGIRHTVSDIFPEVIFVKGCPGDDPTLPEYTRTVKLTKDGRLIYQFKPEG